MSFQEKSLCVEISITIAIFVYYLVKLFGFEAEQLADIDSIMDLLLKIILVSITVSILSHIALSVFNPKTANDQLDEREKLVELKSNQLGYWILQAGISVAVVCYALELNHSAEQGYFLPFVSLHILVISFLLAEVTSATKQLWLLQQGV